MSKARMTINRWKLEVYDNFSVCPVHIPPQTIFHDKYRGIRFVAIVINIIVLRSAIVSRKDVYAAPFPVFHLVCYWNLIDTTLPDFLSKCVASRKKQQENQNSEPPYFSHFNHTSLAHVICTTFFPCNRSLLSPRRIVIDECLWPRRSWWASPRFFVTFV